MPRGVPNSGRRESRHVSPVVVSETTLAGSAVDGAAEPAPVEPQAPAQVELTPDQLHIKHLENTLAVERGRKDVEPEVEELSDPGSGDNIIIHFLEDGFTALGQVWYRGQDLEFERTSQAYKDTFDRLGRTWLDLRNDEFTQAERWGKVMFRNGPWPGKSYSDAAKLARYETVKNADGSTVPAPSEAELTAIEKIELKRRRAAPKLPVR